MLENRRLLRIGGFSLIGVGVCYIIGTVLSVIIGAAPSGAEAYLSALAQHLGLSYSNFVAFAVADVLLVPSTLAFYLLFKDVNKKAMIVGGCLMMLFVVFDFFVTELNSLQLVGMSQNYRVVGQTQGSAYVATANALLSTLPVSTLLSFVVSSLAILIIAVVMLQGKFSRRLAILGICIGVAGTLGGFYIFVPALSALLSPSMFVFGVWDLLVGRKITQHK